MPGETVRALVTLWLLFHLFGIAIALTTNPNALALPSSPTVDIDSPYNSRLFTALKSTPVLSQYMYALWLDAPHDYWLTYGDVTDADHSVDLTLVFPDGHTEQRKLPPDDARGEERERYKALVRQLASPFYSDSPDKSLLASIGQDLLEDSGAKEVQVQIIRHDPLSMEDAKADDPGLHDPNNKRKFVTIYSGTVTVNSLGQGEVHDQDQAARDVAPVTGPRGRTRSPSPPAGNPQTSGNSSAPGSQTPTKPVPNADEDDAPPPPSAPAGKPSAGTSGTPGKSGPPLPSELNNLVSPPEKTP
jgi:hypothetical protein